MSFSWKLLDINTINNVWLFCPPNVYDKSKKLGDLGGSLPTKIQIIQN